jgi:hypothetical protein
MSETETIEREKKKPKKNHYQTIDLRDLREYEQKPQKEREQVYSSRELFLIHEKQREAVDQYRAQQDLLRADMEKFHENMWTKRSAARDMKIKGDLSNLIKATLSDETITIAKGKETERKHRKILGIYHSDHETTTEISIERRGEGQ